MAYDEVLALAVGGRQTAHGHATQHVCRDQLTDRLALVAAEVHANVLKRTLLAT